MALDIKYIKFTENIKLGETDECFGEIMLLSRLIIQNYFEQSLLWLRSHPYWRYSRTVWTQCCAMCSRASLLEQGGWTRCVPSNSVNIAQSLCITLEERCSPQECDHTEAREKQRECLVAQKT